MSVYQNEFGQSQSDDEDPDQFMEEDDDDEEEVQEDEDDDDEEEAEELPAERSRFTRPVVQVGPVDLSLLSSMESDEVRDVIGQTVTDMVEDVQGTLKDPVWAKVQERYKTDQVVTFFKDAPTRSAPAPLKKKAKGVHSDDITPKSLADMLKVEMVGSKGQGTMPKDKTKPGGVFQKGANQPGSWKKDGEVSFVEGPRNYTAEFDISLANELSQTVINYLKSESIKITEAQALILDDRVLISANEAKAVRDLIGESLAGNLGKVSSKVEPWARERQMNLQELRKALRGEGSEAGEERLALIVASANIHPDQGRALATLLRVVRSTHYYRDGTGNSATWVTNAEGAGKIILVGSQGFCHAEQNLLGALARSGYKGASATVAGGKRPCAACHVALELVKRYKYTKLVYVERHGGGWFGSSKASLAKIAEALDIDVATVRAVAKEVLPLSQYATAFESDAPEVEEITDLRHQVLTKKVATDRLPAEVDPPEGIMTDYEDFTVSPSQEQRDQREEAEYVITEEEEIT